MYKGVSLRKQDNNTFYLRFKTKTSSRKDWTTGLKLNQADLLKVIDYAKLVHEKLLVYESELEFENWYNQTIKGKNNQIFDNNQITFKEALSNLYGWFMSQTDRRGYNRKDNLVSSNSSFEGTYQRYLKVLPLDNQVNIEDCSILVNNYYPDHPKSYRESITSVRKLLEVNQLYSLKEQWEKQNFRITNKRNKNERKVKKQTITEEQILNLYEAVIKNIEILIKCRYTEVREWLNAIMIAFIYGLRPIEAFAIKNLECDYQDKQGNHYPAVSKNSIFNPDNPYSIIYIDSHTRIATTVKTGDRQARPLCTLTSNLWLTFNLAKNCQLPNYNPNPNSKEKTQVQAYGNRIGRYLEKWSTKFLGIVITQSYSLRRGGNVNGASYGIPSEIRAQSMGHSRLLNETTYMESMTSEQQRKILMSQVNPISLDQALRLMDNLEFQDEAKIKAIKLIELIYQIRFKL